MLTCKRVYTCTRKCWRENENWVGLYCLISLEITNWHEQDSAAEFARQNTGDFLLRPQKSEQESASIEYLFTTKHTTSVTITCALSWFACCLINYGLLYDTGSFAGDIYINAILLTTIEFPAWFAFYALDYFGRKRTLSVSLFISSVACVALPFTGPLRGGKLQIVFAFLSRLLGNG